MISINEIINNVSDGNREKKYKLFCETFKPDPKSTILDVGAAETEFRATANIIEKRYPYPENITALGVNEFKQFSDRYPKVKAVRYEGGRFPFEDNSFDFCWCNAVIEHVGDRVQQEMFIREIARVARRAFVSTPNRYFIFESHSKVILLHYLPRDIFNFVLKITGNSYPGHLVHLIGPGDMKEMLTRNNITDYRIIKNKLLGFTMDFVVVF